MPSVHQQIASLASSKVSFDLRTEDVCFLAALHLSGEHSGDAVFSDAKLMATFEQACEVAAPTAENPRKRATHAIQRLAEQRMLLRVDGAGLVRAGEYSLTPLSEAIVRYLLADEALTRESLTLLTTTLRGQLNDVKVKALVAESPEAWRKDVVDPLRVTVRDLLAGIDRRQRGLDERHASIRQQIGSLLEADWFASIDQCEKLLSQTTETLAELNAVLLRDTAHLQSTLQDIAHAAESGAADDAADAVQQVVAQVERLSSWGHACQRAWSDYHRYVHGFLRDVVRLDPQRAFSQRLRDQIGGWHEHPFRLIVASREPMRVLREIELREERVPVRRAHSDRRAVIEDVPPDTRPMALQSAVDAALTGGATTLLNVLNAVLPDVPEPQRYGAIGRVAELVAVRRHVDRARYREWNDLSDAVEAQDWRLEHPRKERR